MAGTAAGAVPACGGSPVKGAAAADGSRAAVQSCHLLSFRHQARVFLHLDTKTLRPFPAYFAEGQKQGQNSFPRFPQHVEKPGFENETLWG
ncbi:MAG: hypothetical protein E7320_12885 [Clostridiales bacterium]|nr:hypothetical protein [Clostridiales bacterium]